MNGSLQRPHGLHYRTSIFGLCIIFSHRCKPLLSFSIWLGEVAEWSKAVDSKSIVRLCVPGVRIPPSPPSIVTLWLSSLKCIYSRGKGLSASYTVLGVRLLHRWRHWWAFLHERWNQTEEGEIHPEFEGFISWGISSILHVRRYRPTRVVRTSSRSAHTAPPTASTLCRMVRNFNSV